MQLTGDIDADLANIQCKIALIFGEHSESFSAKSAAHMQTLQPRLSVTSLADAQHHLFLDQPLAFVDALKTGLADWQD